MFNQINTVCFSGYRPEKMPFGGDEGHPRICALKGTLEQAILEAIGTGYNSFISGACRGFDFLAAEAVLKLRRRFRMVTLEAAVPFAGQEAYWSMADRERYYAILRQADRVTHHGENADPKHYLTRDRYMVEQSSLLITYFDGQPGGTAYTNRYALQRGLAVVNLAE